eukprot:14175917-Heterocapsa_arctica.AAC.1
MGERREVVPIALLRACYTDVHTYLHSPVLAGTFVGMYATKRSRNRPTTMVAGLPAATMYSVDA